MSSKPLFGQHLYFGHQGSNFIPRASNKGVPVMALKPTSQGAYVPSMNVFC